MGEYYIGILSGTSMDAIDAAIIDFSHKPLSIVATHSKTMPPEIRTELLELCNPGPNEINRLGKMDNVLGQLCANTINELLNKHNIAALQVIAIGSHGQTIRHCPYEEEPFTLQIGNPNIIAQQTNITTISDFRRRDMALGGQGAPLTPAFHNYLLRSKHNRVIVNIGGISNITLLPADPSKPVIGFDTGPGNTLMDAWIEQHQQKTFDHDGQWAKQGICEQVLLKDLLKDNYFQIAPPKSTGREYFHLNWLQSHFKTSYKPENIQATLLHLTAKCISDAINNHFNEAEIILCGGGARNPFLVETIADYANAHTVIISEQIGIDPGWIEACAFAWLAKQTMEGKAGNLPEVTGASDRTILGAIYPVNQKF